MPSRISNSSLIGICFLDAPRFTRELCDDVDPMPDYENVLTD